MVARCDVDVRTGKFREPGPAPRHYIGDDEAREGSGMARRPAGLIRHIYHLWELGACAGLTDAQLLARFADRREEGAEPAFEALVERHGAMVFRVCRGILRDEH